MIIDFNSPHTKTKMRCLIVCLGRISLNAYVYFQLSMRFWKNSNFFLHPMSPSIVHLLFFPCLSFHSILLFLVLFNFSPLYGSPRLHLHSLGFCARHLAIHILTSSQITLRKNVHPNLAYRSICHAMKPARTLTLRLIVDTPISASSRNWYLTRRDFIPW